MSAWMITDAHADFIATAYLQFVDPAADPQAIGQELLTENARSIRARYPHQEEWRAECDAQAAAYRFTPWRGNVDPENLNKQARCADYQCCEHGEAWAASASCAQLEAMIAKTGGHERALSDEYPWGIDDHPGAAPQLEEPPARPALVAVIAWPGQTSFAFH